MKTENAIFLRKTLVNSNQDYSIEAKFKLKTKLNDLFAKEYPLYDSGYVSNTTVKNLKIHQVKRGR